MSFKRKSLFWPSVIITITGLLITGGTSGVVAAVAPSKAVAAPSASSEKLIIKLASAQVGTKESPAKSNRQKYGETYGANGVAWCAIFEWWLFDQLHMTDALPGKFASVYQMQAAFEKQGRFDKNPKPGDIVILDYGQGHTGIVVSVQEKSIETIEGNTSPTKKGSQDNGGEVAKKERPRNNHIVGYGHPDYAKAQVPSESADVIPTDKACFQKQKDQDKEFARKCWMPLLTKYASKWKPNEAFNVLWCESRGDPNAYNPQTVYNKQGVRLGNATGLMEILDGPKDPEANVKQASDMYANRGWQPWECKP